MALRVGIVGGSIAGCAVGNVLSRLGHDVTVFERSPNLLEDRGGGIGMPVQVVEGLRQAELVDASLLGVQPKSRLWVVKEGADPLGRGLFVQPMAVINLHWGALYRQLVAGLPPSCYRRNAEVVAVRSNAIGGSLEFKDGNSQSFDLIIGADGHSSLVRRELFPDAERVYAGYPAWRGVLEERELPDSAPVQDVVLSPGTQRGHAPFYLIPGTNGETGLGSRRLNWLWYDASIPDDVIGVRVDSHGRRDVSSIAPGQMSIGVRAHLLAAAYDQLPPWFAHVIERTRAPSLQPLYDVTVPNYVVGRVCLVGDAGSTARPHTGSGTTKAIQDAQALGAALQAAKDPDAGLAAYDRERTESGRTLVELGRALGREQVVECPDWRKFDHAGFVAWLASSSLKRAYYARSDSAGRG